MFSFNHKLYFTISKAIYGSKNKHERQLLQLLLKLSNIEK